MKKSTSVSPSDFAGLSGLKLSVVLISMTLFLDSCKLFRRNESRYDDRGAEVYRRPSSSSGSHTKPEPKVNTTVKKAYTSRTINEIVANARNYFGVPYRSGGTDASGMDCSGLLFTVYQNVGFQIPRISWQQAEFGSEVSIDDLKIGDWLFFVTGKGDTGTINHAGLVTEIHSATEVLFIHSSTSKGVREDNLYNKYWISNFAKAIRPF
ncbi:Cell wall-associated hydrolase, NlpC family [Pseudarcicella hirudinis]|uniref:Cell wall-associated hydrolase, NlpC family n=1 Tax=Pseudarcicella hirudinis TaxID=1079859 RepID=A0A1I5MHB1_9BACT|nr:C40 family peptidase [Pseudarcicella hirudinis]SFP09028.1 Cell wall-associated hydrolase, NlpC family [Pseudarcicella hirudinis]